MQAINLNESILKQIFFLLIILFSAFLYAQKVNSETDSIYVTEKESYIADYNNQLNIKLDVSNDIKLYYVHLDGITAHMRPNINIRYALAFNYRFVSLSLGIRPENSEKSKNDKGESDVFRIRMKLLFPNWTHRFEYEYIYGYYMSNSGDLFEDITKTNKYIQFPHLKTNFFNGTTAYKFNKNYSLKSILSQTEIQLKSAGSFVASVDYGIYEIKGTGSFINLQGEVIKRDHYNDYLGFNTIFNMGYYYTYVHKKWFANIYAIPGAGIDFHKTSIHSPDNISNRYVQGLVFSIQSGAGLGYSSEKYYLGLEYTNRYFNQQIEDNDDIFQTSRNTFQVFVGYRFKAPKTVSRPVEYIEKKVPILDKDKR